MERIQNFWLNQTSSEYNSSARTIHLVHWMQQIAMSPDLIRDAIRIADDEMVHSQLCYAIAAEAGCTSGLAHDELSLSLTEQFDDLRKSFLYVLVESYCFGETVAVPLFSAMRKGTHNPTALTAYNRILEDEPRHAAFGWLSLAWCDEMWPETQMWLAEIVPDALASMRDAYGVSGEYEPVLSEQEQLWGMMPKARYQQILEKTIKGTFTERLRHYNVIPV
ncbi:MAG: ferritin-like domain-containing protein [Leucothrix sp.]